MRKEEKKGLGARRLAGRWRRHDSKRTWVAILAVTLVVLFAAWRTPFGLWESDLSEAALKEHVAYWEPWVASEVGWEVERVVVHSATRNELIDAHEDQEFLARQRRDYRHQLQRDLVRAYLHLHGMVGKRGELWINREGFLHYTRRYPEVADAMLELLVIHELVHVHQHARAQPGTLGPMRRVVNEGHAQYVVHQLAKDDPRLLEAFELYQKDLGFEYTVGATFVGAVAERVGRKAVYDYLLEHLPQDEEEIAHPERYCKRIGLAP